MRVGLLSNLNSCGFSGTTFFPSTEHGAIVKRIMCGFFHYVNCIYFFACLRFYFSNSLLAVSYNGDIRLRLMLTVNQAGLCWISVAYLYFILRPSTGSSIAFFKNVNLMFPLIAEYIVHWQPPSHMPML